MLPPINCARALLILCIITTQSQGQHDTREGPPNEFDRCENMTVFFNTLNLLSPVEGFKLITSPLACETCPVEIKTLRRDLTVLVARGMLNVKKILRELGQAGSRNRYDSLITALLAMNEFLNVDATIKESISNAVFYLLKKRYLRKNDGFSTVRSGFCEYPTYARLAENHPHEGTGVYAGGVRKYHPETQPDSTPLVYSTVPKPVVKPAYQNYYQPVASTAYIPPQQRPFYATDFYHHPLAQVSSASNPNQQESSLRKLAGSHEDDPEGGECLVKTLALLFNQLFGKENARGYH